MGALLDLKFSPSTKSKAAYIGILVTVTGCWIWNAIVEVDVSRRSTPVDFDLGDGAFFGSAFAVYILFKFFYEAMQVYLYWLLGARKGTQNNGEVSRMTGIMRSWESIGSAIAYGIGASSVSDQTQMIVALALWVFTIPFTLIVVFGYWDKDTEAEDEPEAKAEWTDRGVDSETVVVPEHKGDGHAGGYKDSLDEENLG